MPHPEHYGEEYISAIGPGHLAVIKSTTNSSVYQKYKSRCEATCLSTNAKIRSCNKKMITNTLLLLFGSVFVK